MNDKFIDAAKLAFTIAAGYIIGASVVSHLLRKNILVAKKLAPSSKPKMRFVGFPPKGPR